MFVGDLLLVVGLLVKLLLYFICSIQKVPRLLVASQDGYLYIYNLDPNEGGECMLLRQHRYY